MTNYFKTLLSGIKASIEKNSKNDWNANKDEIGYIENRPFYEETKTVNVNVADEGFIVYGYAYILSEEDATIVFQALETYYQTHSEPPETITVILDDETYELPFNADNFTYGATIDSETLLPDFSNYPIAFLLDGGITYITKNIYNSFGCIIDNSTVVEDSTLYSVYGLGNKRYLYTAEFSNDDWDSFVNFLTALHEDLPDFITIAIDDINYTLLKGSYIIDSDEYYYYGAPAINSHGTINFDFSECPLCLDLDSSSIYFSPAFENFSTVSITYDGTTYLDNAHLIRNYRDLDFSSGQQFSFISQDIFNDLPNNIVANIDGTVYQLPKVGYENEGEIAYLGYGASLNGDGGVIDFSNYPVFLTFLNQNGQITWGNNACKFYEQIENISLSYSVEKTIIHKIDKKFIPVVDIQVDDYIDWDNMTSENPVQNKVLANVMDDMWGDINTKANTNSPVFSGIPTAPTAPTTSDSNQIATTAFVKTAVDNINVITTTTGVLNTSAWDGNAQTINVAGVTADNAVIIVPQSSYKDAYNQCGIYCRLQGAGTLTFNCLITPIVDITVDICII